MTKVATRVQNLPPYPFATLARELTRRTAAGADIIRLDMGNPDMPPAKALIDVLVDASRDDTMHGYGPYSGIPPFRAAIATYYQRRFGVTLDSATQLTPLIGSKEGLVNIQLAWANPGDVVLVPDPAYPVYARGATLAGAEVVTMPLVAKRGWLPDLSAIPAETAHRARILWLNYPNNPTGALATLDFFAEAIDFCRRYDILLCHDNPYCDVTYDGYVAPSPLQIKGAADVTLEFNSLSKSYNLAGWRVGMAVGNAAAVSALATIKTQIDTNMSKPVQHMATAALQSDPGMIQTQNRVYQQRRDMVVQTLRGLGLTVTPPQATLYLWFQTPTGVNDVEFQQMVLDQADVSIAPGSFYGPSGAGWMRLSLSVPTERLQTAMNRLAQVKF